MNRRGMTLVEMLVAMTVTLMLMGAIAQIFAVFGSAVSDSRGVTELDTRMRAVAWRLRSDLAGATAPMLPPLQPDSDVGYFEVIEGPNNDTTTYFDPFTGSSVSFDKTGLTPGPDRATSDDRLHGDTDDVLLFTTRSRTAPFLGRFAATTGSPGKYESPVAEVCWFLQPARNAAAPATVNPTTYSLHRRQLLVVGYVGAEPFASASNMLDSRMQGGRWGTLPSFYADFDLSVRLAKDSNQQTYIPNTLSDLTRRESRFLHFAAGAEGITDGSTFPTSFPITNFQDNPPPDGLTLSAPRQGEDVVLTNVIGFDVRVFDPLASVKTNGTTVLTPGDPGFASASFSGQGCYVDLGHGDQTIGSSGRPARFRDYGHVYSNLNAADATQARVWDTWSTHYETNGYDEDGIDGVVQAQHPWRVGNDQGANGLDDNADGGVDEGPFDADGDGEITSLSELGEAETSPPYPYPIRGLEIRLRCYEPSSRQVRQVTIRHAFVP